MKFASLWYRTRHSAVYNSHFFANAHGWTVYVTLMAHQKIWNLDQAKVNSSPGDRISAQLVHLAEPILEP